MKEPSRTNQELIKEISALKKKNKEQEQAESDRKKAEESRRESEQQLRLFVHNLHASVVVHAPDSQIILANEQASKLLGLSVAQMMGKTATDPVWRFVREDETPMLLEEFPVQSVLATNQPVRDLVMGIDRPTTNDRVWVLVNALPELDAYGRLRQVVVTFVDITERKQAEEALRESEARYRQLFENAPAGIYEVDLTTGRLLSVNDALCEYTGYTRYELLNLNALDLLTEESQKIFIKRMAGYAAGEPVPSSLEYKARSKSGREFWMSINPKYFYKEGIPVRASVVARDITEFKQAEVRLQESKERYRALFERSVDLVYLTDFEGNFIDANDAALELLGYTKKDIESLNFASFLTDDQIPLAFEAVEEILKTGSQKEVAEFKLRQKDGGYVYVESMGSLIYREGKPYAIQGIARNITERKQSEKALRESELLWRLSIDYMLEAYALHEAIFDETGRMVDYRFLEFNPAAQKISNIAREEIIGKTALELYPHIAERGLLDRYADVMATGVPAIINDFYYVGDNLDKAFDISCFRIDDQHFVCVFRDISERKQTEEALRESENKFRSFAEHSLVGIYMIQDGIFSYVNPKFAEIFGYTVEECLNNMHFRQCVYPEDFDIVQEQVRKRALGETQSVHYAFRGIKKTGEIIHVEIFGSSIMFDGRPTVTGTMLDITERKRAEEERRSLEERLQRSEKMEALGQLAGGVAHDLNNVLGIVVGYAELILMNADESSPMRPHLVNIMNGGQRAAAIVDDLLTLARRGVSGRDVLNLNKIIADCQQSPEFEKLYSYHPAVKIKTDIEPGLPNISGSSVHLIKSLYNLVSNASEAMTKGGTVTIKTTNQYLDKPIQGYDHIQEGDYVVLSVSDTGGGIHEVDLKRIFEPFYTKKVMGRSGTGLGLAVVWGTVKDHNGYINIESEEGKGSTFTLYFPVTREDVSVEAVAIAISEYMGKGESILVVDDVKEQRDLAAGMLTKLNYNVSSVSSGEEAVSYMKEHKVDLMVLDMIMDPGMDGLDTYKSVLAIHPKQKAIIVSGFSESDRVKTAKGLGAGAYVRKPYVIEKLGLAVRKELDRK